MGVLIKSIVVTIILLNTWFGCSSHPMPLSLGDKVPDISLGRDLSGNRLPTFSEIKGKLIILDFWYSGCASCIEAIPKLENLQAHFKDSIRLFLVNPFEDVDEMRRRIELPYMKAVKETSLPVIYEADALLELFPHHSVPHHVWIGAKGEVILIGSSLNTNKSKLSKALNGEDISILRNSNNSLSWDADKSLFGEESVKKHVQYAEDGVIFTDFIDEYASTVARSFNSVESEIGDTIRRTFLNFEVLELYRTLFEATLRNQDAKIVFSGQFNSNTKKYWLNYFLLNVQDTLSLTASYLKKDEITDRDFVECRYSFEQRAPNWMNRRGLDKKMLRQLNSFFSTELGIFASLVYKDLQCYVLVRKGSNESPMQGKSGEKTELKMNLAHLFHQVLSEHPQDEHRFIVDETGISSFDSSFDNFRLDQTAIVTIEDLFKLLNENGIAIKQEIRTFAFVKVVSTH